MNINGNERVLVCPLGWGLGHASRMIPVINFLLRKGCTVLVAGDVTSNTFIKSRLPNLEYLPFPSISVKLASSRFQVFQLAKIAIKVLLRTVSEQKQLSHLIVKHNINLVISDNRYGLYSSEIPSILVTHQLSPIFPKPFGFMQRVGERYIRKHSERFTECWIPDCPSGFSFSGRLSQPKRLPKNVVRVGLLSRFSDMQNVEADTTWDLVAMVSGPEPHRTIFEQQIVKLSVREKLKTLILTGQPLSNSKFQLNEFVTIEPNPNDLSMARVLLGAKYLICRAGYSTIMDLVALNRTAILVPTPGQTEQEYLAKHLNDKKLFSTCHQKNISKVNLATINEREITITKNRFFPITNY